MRLDQSDRSVGRPSAVGRVGRVASIVVTFRSTTATAPMLASASTFTGVKVAAKATVAKTARRANVVTRAGQYDDELLQTAVRRVFFFFF